MLSEMSLFREFGVDCNDNLTSKTVLFVDKSIAIDPMFEKDAQSCCGLIVMHSTNRTVINSDMKRLMDDKIGKTINYIEKDSKMVLVNAFHFKVEWKLPICRNSLGTFSTADGVKLSLPFLELWGPIKAGYLAKYATEILEIPLTICRLNLFIALPDEGSSIAELFRDDEKCACGALLNSIKKSDLEMKSIAVRLPKFRLEYGQHFDRFMDSQDITDAFSPNRADFSAMSTNFNNFRFALSDFVTKTVFELSEECSLTQDELKANTIEPQPSEIVEVSRPFVFGLTAQYDIDRRLFFAIGFIKNPTECGCTV
ncbi:hypothetical protein B4U79_16989 [Dinothrombium tinctorium]|uniref:Serpin domain-containing protein n=1 Tax=Dinothrombium tinctorium TaxID=1965070 RepID=A0A443Q9G3_9ACAR|nr:hypothetical protein B4U79_16989 [Dinothrombium tinctorium]